MKRRTLLSLLLSAAFALFMQMNVRADEAFRNHRYSSFKALPACQKGDIVFIGNSITNMMNWYEAFGSRQNIHGRGNSGGFTQEILDNLESMVAGNPSKVFLMIGTNDLGTTGDNYTPAAVAQRIQKILTRIYTEAPNATVYYQSILPSTVGARTQAKTEETNRLVKEWIEARNSDRIVYVDLYTPLVAANGALKETTASASATSYSYDGLHLTQKGYRIWMDIIKDYVGYECVYPEAATNLWGGLTGSNGMRVTYFGASPVKDTDILLIGDEMIHNGEWHELLGSADFKDRGIGWGYPSVGISQVEGTFDAILSGNADNNVVSKVAPRAVCLYVGLSDVQAGTSAAVINAKYKAAVNKLRGKMPDTTPIFIMTILPFASNDATRAQKVIDVNTSLKALADDDKKIYIIDTYAATYMTARDESCFMGSGNIYLTGLGYVRVAQKMAETINEKLGTDYQALTTEEAKKNMERFDWRTAIYRSETLPSLSDTLKVQVDKNNGNLYRAGAVSTGWSGEWRSDDGLLTFAAGANNMQWNGTNIDARSGQSKASSYTIACNPAYVIIGYTMKLTALTDNAQTWAFENKNVVTSSATDPKVVTYSGLSAQSVSMTLTGENQGTLISDFVVMLQAKKSAVKVDMTNGTIEKNAWTTTAGDSLLTLGVSGEGEIQHVGDSLKLSQGTYVLTTSGDYRIAGYEFSFTCPEGMMSVTPQKGSKVEGPDGYVSVMSNQGDSLFFVLSGTAESLITSNFYVYLERISPEELDDLIHERFVVFETPSSTSEVPYRIPAIAKTRNGNLVAVADYRYSKADIGMATNGKLDLRFRIKDYETGEWGAVQTLAAARGTGSQSVAFGDPCIVADRESDRVLVTSCCGNVSFPNGTHANHQGWARFYSEDGGQTWSDYTDISQQVFDQLDKRSDGQIRCFFIGSGKIVQSTTVKVGDYYRLYCAALVKVNSGTNTNYVFYSDDFGENWKLLGTPDDCPIPSGADEPKAEELPDGSVLVSSRISGGRYYNVYHFTNTATGEGKWGTMAASNSAVGGITASSNACNGETLCLPVERTLDGKKMFLLLQSVPFGPSDRSHVGINYKELADLSDFRLGSDVAKDWDGKKQVTTKTSAYSTMTLDADNNLAFFYEEDNKNSGYDMVYKKYTIEEITNDDYTYAGMATADSAAYMTNAVNNYMTAIEDMFGDIVGMYSEEARATIEAARAAYVSEPVCRNYEAFNSALATAKRVEVEPAKKYYLRNYGRSTSSATYVMSLNAAQTYFVGADISTASVEDANQFFRFLPAENEGEFYLYHSKSKLYFGRLGNNEAQTVPVSTRESAGVFCIESSPEGLSALRNVNKTGSNQYIHLAGDNTRLVPWGATEPSLWYIVPISDEVGIDTVETETPVAEGVVYDLMGRKVSRILRSGIYITDSRKKIRVR